MPQLSELTFPVFFYQWVEDQATQDQTAQGRDAVELCPWGKRRGGLSQLSESPPVAGLCYFVGSSFPHPLSPPPTLDRRETRIGWGGRL